MSLDDLHRWIAPLGWTLVHFAWQGVAVAFVAWAMITLARDPRVRHAIGCVAMVAMLACPIATLAWIGADAPTIAVTATVAPRLAGELARRSDDAAERRAISPAKPTHSLRDRIAHATPALVAIWLVGVSILAVRHLVGVAQLIRLRRGATAIVEPLWRDRVGVLSIRLDVRRRVALLLTDRLDCPAVVGAIRPAILWPLAAMSGLTPTQIEALLAHELAHVRRHDYAVNLLQTLVETLLFYHPAVWWLSRRVRQEREHCCDDLAASAIGDRATYADALAAMESLRQSPAFALSANGGSLVTRVRRLLAPTSPRRLGPVGVGLIVATLVLVGVFACKPREPVAAATTKPATTPAFDDRIAVGDLLRVSIGELEASGKTTHILKRVANDGTITLPYFKVPIELRGMTTAQAERRIADAYGKAAIISDPNVGVLVVQGADGRSVPAALFAESDPSAATTSDPARVPHDRIAAGDLMRVTIQDLVGMGVQSAELRRVEQDGTIPLPYVGNVGIVGETAAQAEAVIVEAYRMAGVLPRAIVGVLIVQDAEGHALVPAGFFTPEPAKPQAAEQAQSKRAIADLTAQLDALKRQSPQVATPIPAAASLTDERRITADPSIQRLEASRDQAEFDRKVAVEKFGPESTQVRSAMAGVAALDAELEKRRQEIAARNSPQFKIGQLHSQRNELIEALAAATRDHGESSDEALAVRGLLSQLDQQIAMAIGLIGEYSVSGAVARPGVYSLTGRRVTLMQALSSAGCAAPAVPDSDPADDFGIDVVRRDPVTAKETRTRYQWSDITHGKLATFCLLPNDQIFVGVGGATTAPATTQATSD